MKEIDTSTRSNDTLLEDQKEGAPITDLSITYSTASDLDSDSGFEFVLSAADSRRVQLSKALFVLTLFLAAVGVATWTYIATSSDEHEDFKSLVSNFNWYLLSFFGNEVDHSQQLWRAVCKGFLTGHLFLLSLIQLVYRLRQ